MKKILLTTALVLSTLLAFGQGYSLDFDGTGDYVEIADDAVLDFTDNYTIEAWIYISTAVSNGGIVSKYQTTSADGFTFRLLGTGNFLGLDFNELKTNDDILSAGTWQHVAAVKDGGSHRVYLNGVEQALSGTALIQVANNEIVSIGSDLTTDGARYFNGNIDEVRIWNDVRTADEIRANMHRELADPASEINLIAYYQMSDGSGNSLTDDKSATYNGNFGDGADNATYPAWAPSGCFAGPGNALSFTNASSQFVTIADNDALDLTDNFTIEAWVYPTAFIQLAGIVSKYNTDASNGFAFRLTRDENYSGLSFNQYETADGVLTQDQWQHVVAVKDNGSYMIYVNGIEQNITAVDAIYEETANTDPVNIGADAGRYFDGNIDEVRIWDDVRSVDEIRQNMFMSLSGAEANLVAYYRFDQAEGTTLYDLTTNALDGSMTNMDGATDWVASSAYNTWLGGTSTTWTEATNWSLETQPSGEGIGIFNFPLINAPQVSSTSTINNLYAGRTFSVSDYMTVTDNIYIDADLTLTSNATTSTIGGSLAVLSGNTLTMNAGSKLTVSGTLENAGSIFLYSPPDNGSSASLITEGTLTNTGIMTIQRWVSQGTLGGDLDLNWHSIGIPVSAATAGSYFTGDYLILYLEPDNGWANIEDTEIPLNVGTGYLLKTVNGDRAYNFSGTFNTGTYDLNLINTSSDATHGYNLVSNPYPSAIDLELLGRSNIDNTFWIWDPATENYLTYQVGGGGTLLTSLMEPGQAFFAKVSDGFAAGVLSIENADRTHSSTGSFYKSTAVNPERIILEVSNKTGKDKVILNYQELENSGYKLFSMNPLMPQIFIQKPELDYVIWNQEELSEDLTIPLGYFSELTGNTSITLEENSIADYHVILKDIQSGAETLLNPAEEVIYDFNHDANSESARFELIFSSTTNINDDNLLKPKANDWCNIAHHPSGVRIEVQDANDASVRIINILGQMKFASELGSQSNIIPLDQEGIYIIQVTSEFGTIQEKYVFSK